jgi:glycosyltransferase involved in cell wall biosynthesis
MNPKVSVCIITYNHEKFVSQALDGVLMQKTDFNFEVLIGEDDSSDDTRKIVKEYARRYPGKIRLFLNNRRDVIYINSKPTGRYNLINNLKHSQGEYIALLEGDDFWSDQQKLQKQVDFLEDHPECSMCFHWVDRLDEESGQLIDPPIGPEVMQEAYALDDLYEQGNFIGTCSVVYRNRMFKGIPDWYYNVPVGDFPLHLLNAAHGKIGFIDEIMGVYRMHKGGVFSEKNFSHKCKITLDVYSFIGTAMQIRRQKSFRLGVLKFKKMLFRSYLSEGKKIKAFVAAVDAVLCSRSLGFLKTINEILYNISPKIYKKFSLKTR